MIQKADAGGLSMLMCNIHSCHRQSMARVLRAVFIVKETLMPDRYGPRGVFAIMIPLQNANMQPEYEMMRPRGINNQIFRFTLAQHDKAPDAMVAAMCVLLPRPTRPSR